jgi:hypothetical protein
LRSLRDRANHSDCVLDSTGRFAEEKRMELEQALTAIERAKSVAELSAVLFDWRNESRRCASRLSRREPQPPRSGGITT